MQNPLPFISFSRATRGRVSSGKSRTEPPPPPPPQLGFSTAGQQSSVGENVPGMEGGMEGWMEAAHSPWQGPQQLHSLGMGDVGSPGMGWGWGGNGVGGQRIGARHLAAGHKPNQEESEHSSLAHPSVERQGGGTQAEERRCGRGGTVSGAGLICSPSGTHRSFPTLGLGGSPCSQQGGFGSITHQCNPTTSLGGCRRLSPSSHPFSPQEPRDKQDKDPAPRVINYLLTN